MLTFTRNEFKMITGHIQLSGINSYLQTGKHEDLQTCAYFANNYFRQQHLTHQTTQSSIKGNPVRVYKAAW